MTIEIKNLILEYSNFVNQFDGNDTIGLNNISNDTLHKAKAYLTNSEFDELKIGINDFLLFNSKLKEMNIKNVKFKSHLIGLAIFVEAKFSFII